MGLGQYPPVTLHIKDQGVSMIEFDRLGHINVIVDDIDFASDFYAQLFGAIKVQRFPHFKNIGFAKSAGFLESPSTVDVSIEFLNIPGANIFLELFCYHTPQGAKDITFKKTHDMGGPRHICIRVKDIDKAFAHVKSMDGVRLINDSPEYKPFKIDEIHPNEFMFYDEALENNPAEKQKVCDIIGNIRYFYFVDRYGIQWEFEQGHSDVGH